MAEVANGPQGEKWRRWLLTRAAEDLGIPADDARSPGLDSVDSFLDNMKSTGTYIVFVGVGELTVPPDPESFSDLAKKSYC